MYIIGENIHIISPRVKEALAEFNGPFFTDLARRQVEAGAQALDLNIGPRKKDGPEIMAMAAGPGVRRRAGCRLFARHDQPGRHRSRSAEDPARPRDHQLHLGRARAAGEGAARRRSIRRQAHRLTMGSGMIPVKADERVEIALEKLIPRAIEAGVGVENLIIDPLVLTVSGCQEYCPECIEAVRTLKYAWDPAPTGQRGALQRLQCRAARDAPAAQPGVHGHADGRRRGHGDRRSV